MMKYCIVTKEGRDEVRAAIAQLDLERPWSVEIKEWKKTKTNPQIAYYHAVVIRTMAQTMGEDHNALHEHFCGEFFGVIEYEILGKNHVKPARSLTKPDEIDAETMSDFIEFVIAIAAKNGIMIPSPRERVL